MLHLFRKPDSEPRKSGGERLVLASNVTTRRHAGGATFLHSGRGTVFSCNEVGARIWQGLAEGRGVEQIAPELAQEYRAPLEMVAADTDRFLGELENAGILLRGRRA
jgi:Coenzyme PQQ synthesis protein D (PqqD)